VSWEYTKHRAICKKCGREGVRISGSDDWNQYSTEWEGFESEPPDPYLVGRKKVVRGIWYLFVRAVAGKSLCSDL
jgi:hypothetical protein